MTDLLMKMVCKKIYVHCTGKHTALVVRSVMVHTCITISSSLHRILDLFIFVVSVAVTMADEEEERDANFVCAPGEQLVHLTGLPSKATSVFRYCSSPCISHIYNEGLIK